RHGKSRFASLEVDAAVRSLQAVRCNGDTGALDLSSSRVIHWTVRIRNCTLQVTGMSCILDG
ncbi:hypothetical protein AMECASPLE_033886, partial [Ameca splendens]